MALDTRRCFWFGTEDRAGFFATPLKGADSSPSAWGVDGTLLNGGGYGFNSFGSHKRYTYEWPQSSSPETAQIMKSYRDGTYGRGLLYFLEPGIYRTNILPAHWADPSMSLDNEAPSLVYGIDPIAVPTSGGSYLNLPINSAQYDLSAVPVQTVPTPDSSVFLPVPTGHTLFLGAFYSSTGTGGIFATPINSNGTLGVTVKLTEKNNADTDVVVDRFEGDIKGVRLWVGRSSAVDSSVTIAAMSGRLLETIDAVSYGPWGEQARNLTSNPSFESSSGTVTVKTNYALSPFGTATLPGYFAYPASSSANDGNVGGVALTNFPAPPPIPGHPASATSLTIPAGAATGGGLVFATGVPAGDHVVSMWVNRRSGATTQMQFAVRGVAGFGTARTFTFDQWVYLEETITITPAQAPAVIGWRSVNVVDPTATNFIVANMQVAPAGQNVPQGDLVVSGAGTGYDPDMTASFTGTAQASPSILTGVGLTGVVPIVSPAIRSTQWSKEGGASMRLVPNASPSSRSQVATPTTTIGQQYTVIATARLSAPQSGSLSPYARIIEMYEAGTATFHRSAPAPNAPGEHEVRLTYTATTTSGSLRLWNGALAGNGDVWWDLVAIVEGAYTGPAFSGSTVPTSDQEQYRWLGGANASASVYETRTRTGDPSTQAALVAGPWIGGQGHSGCRFIGTPSYVNNGPVEGGRVGFAASFVEVGSWVYG